MLFGWRARIGNLRPATAIEGSEEWRRVAPEGVAFVDGRTMVEEVTEKGLAAMMTQVVGAAKLGAAAKPQVIVQCGAPGIFLRGLGHDRTVIEEMEKATGIPATTMMTAMVDAMRVLGVRRVAVGTTYIDEVNAKLTAFLEGSGFEVAAMKGLQQRYPAEAISLEDHHSYRLGREVFSQAKGADGLLISCGGFRTFEIIQALEGDTGVPVVTSNQSALWKALRMAGVRDDIPSLGALLRR